MNTVERLEPTVATFGPQIGAILDQSPHARLIGSFGRAILLGDNPFREFSLRGEPPLIKPDGEPRDTDWVGIDTQQDPYAAFPIDTLYVTHPQAAVVHTRSGWRLQSAQSSFDELLDPAVMAPVEGETVYSVPARTVCAQTHLALIAVRANKFPKDAISTSLLRELIDADATPLPDRFYDPFRELIDIQQRRPVPRIMRLVAPDAYRQRYLPSFGPATEREQ